MYADPLQLVFECGTPQTPVKRDFVLTSLSDNSSVRKVLGAPAGWPNTMRISHQNSGKGENARVRHLLRFDTCKVVSAPDLPGSENPTVYREGEPIASIYMVLDVPVGWEQSQQVAYLFRQFLGAIRGSDGAPINWLDPEAELPELAWMRGFINGLV